MLLTGIVTNDCKFCTHCHVRFHGENRTFSYTVALMPSVTVDLLFRLRYLSGECHYPPMEPGTLKSSIGGSIRPDEIRRVSIGFTGCGCTYTLRNLRFSDIFWNGMPLRDAEALRLRVQPNAEVYLEDAAVLPEE